MKALNTNRQCREQIYRDIQIQTYGWTKISNHEHRAYIQAILCGKRYKAAEQTYSIHIQVKLLLYIKDFGPSLVYHPLKAPCNRCQFTQSFWVQYVAQGHFGILTAGARIGSPTLWLVDNIRSHRHALRTCNTVIRYCIRHQVLIPKE